MLLALDISTEATGFAVGDVHSPRPRSGVWRLPKGPSNFLRALSSLRLAITGVLKLDRVTAVLVEAPMRRMDGLHGADAAYVLISLAAVAQEAGHSFGARVDTVAVQTWRKTVFGTGFPDNPKAAATGLCDSMGWPYETHDVAEASLIWMHGMLKTEPKWSMPRMRSKGAMA